MSDRDPNRDYEGAVGIGEHRPPGERWPGPPSEHAPGPAFDSDDPRNELAQQWLELAGAIQELGRELASAKPDGPTGVASGMTDADGMAAIIVYRCAAGEQFRLRRAVVEAQGFSPASPFSAADAWLGFYDLAQEGIPESGLGLAVNDIYQGALKDFGPVTSGGPLFPSLFVDGEEQATEIRGPHTLMLIVFEGPASTRITCNYQGLLRRSHGIA